MEIEQQERNRDKMVETTTESSNKQKLPSATSSPSHEFSFTISMHSSATTITTAAAAATSPTLASSKTKQQQPPLAIDLSPADDIFFHGHLLPLHFLSHLHASASPRSSTHSSDSFTLPIREILREEKENPINNNTHETTISCNCEDDCEYQSINEGNIGNCGSKERIQKSKPFSLFGLAKWRKGSETKEKTEGTENKKKLKFDVSQFVRRYIKMVKPLLSHKGGRRENIRGRRQSYSFSGTVSPRDNNNNYNYNYNNNRELMRGRRGEFSAPASMRTSPTNSGLLLATAGVPSPVSDSTMEELQAAIQAAIAHCKNSIAAEDKSQERSSVPVN